MNTRLGIWGGPDGFGETPQQERERIETMVGLCRDYHFELFKMDAVCGQLRPEKYDAFDRMMRECRKYSADLILLNHRLTLGKGTAHSTTFLLGGAETYIDVHMANEVTAPHHRVEALARELPPNLTRLTEDHGVCLSSCLDYWEDDLILQAFNRSLILAPELYGNPWLLRDQEFSALARMFNIHRQYRDILVTGMPLPEAEYGVNAVARGDKQTRLVTLRNLSWETKRYAVRLDESVGLEKNGKLVEVKQYHPTEKIIGLFPFGTTVPVEVLPFRASLVKITNAADQAELNVVGTDYKVVNDKTKAVIQLLGMPGDQKEIRLSGKYKNFTSATLNGKDASGLLRGRAVKVLFPGKPRKNPYHRKLAAFTACDVPADAESLYEATCFAADNNALEVRSLQRSGPTKISAVDEARNAFFNQPLFKERELWDRYLFDGDLRTAFSHSARWRGINPEASALRLDFGDLIRLDSIVIHAADEFSIAPLKSEEAEYAAVSADLVNWQSIAFLVGKKMTLDLHALGQIRYLRIQPGMLRIQEIEGYRGDQRVDSKYWRASNLFRPYIKQHWRESMVYAAQKAWKCQFVLEEIPKGSYLCIAINGQHGVEGATAAIKVNGKYIGSPDRSPSFQSNTWEVAVRETDKNYTYYIPLTPAMKGQKIEAFTLALNADLAHLTPEAWITAYPIPFEELTLELR